MTNWPKSWFVVGFITFAIECVLKYTSYLSRLDDVLLLNFFNDSISFNIVYVENRHSAFGMLRSVPDWANKALLFTSLCALIFLAYQQVTSADSTAVTRRGIFCFIVGAAGNMVDRCSIGAVVDYIDIRIGTYTLAWNISDLVINLGFAHILYDLISSSKKSVKKD